MTLVNEGEPTGGEPFRVRIDELLSSALSDQAREQRELREVVEAARGAVAGAHAGVEALRLLLEERDRAVVDLLEARLSGTATAESVGAVAARVDLLAGGGGLAAALEAARAELSARLEELARHAAARRRASGEEAKALEASLSRLGERIDRVEAAVEDLRLDVPALAAALERRAAEAEARQEAATGVLAEQLRRAVKAVHERVEGLAATTDEGAAGVVAATERTAGRLEDRLDGLARSAEAALKHATASVERAVEPLVREVGRLAARVGRQETAAEATGALVEGIRASLVGYLADRDARLEAVRDQVLADLIDRMTVLLGRRDRVRLADALRQAEQERKDRRDAARFRRTKLPTGLSDEAARAVAEEMGRAGDPAAGAGMARPGTGAVGSMADRADTEEEPGGPGDAAAWAEVPRSPRPGAARSRRRKPAV